MDAVGRIREYLKREYGISSDEELMQAVNEQRMTDIGIFVSNIGMEGGNVKAVG